MDEIVKAVTSQLVGAIAVLGPALVAVVFAWLSASKAKIEAQRQAALGAVVELEAVTGPQIDLDGAQKKAIALVKLAERLPRSMQADAQKLDKLVEEAWLSEQVKRTSVAPPADDDNRRTSPVPPPPAP